jgi:hypothetical protein
VWWAGSTALDVYLGTRAALICFEGKRLFGQGVAGEDAGFDVLGSALGSMPHARRLRVWLSGGLCRPFLLPSVAGVRDDQEVQRVATALAADATGLHGPLQVWVESAAASQARVAVAIEAAVLRRVNALCAGHRRRVVAIRPWWAEVQRAGLAGRDGLAALSVQDCDSVTLLFGRDGDLESASTVTPVLDAETARTAFARATLSSSVDAQNTLSIRLMPELPEGASALPGLAIGYLARMVGR